MFRLYPLFFLSGAAGLVYQVVWSRIFHEVFGVSVYAITTVLAIFLAGLAFGGIVLGRVVDRRENPLRFYGWLEIGIALTAVIGFFTVRLLAPLNLWAANRMEPDSVGLILVRALIAAVVIFPPTFLMGGTLPAITRVFVSTLERLGRELSLLYALNTMGAVVGSLAAGFFLIGSFGLHDTLWIAVVANGLVGVVSLRFAAKSESAASAARPAVETKAGARAGVGLLIVIGASGFVTLGLEILWTRALVMILGTTTYAFVTMLSSFLTGIALGALVVRGIVDRSRHLRPLFGWIQLAIAASTLITVPLIGSGVTQDWLTGRGEHWLVLFGLRFAVSFLVMLVPAFLIGTTFPLAARIWTRDLRRLSGDVGTVYGCNTAGNIAGAVITGFVLLPALGLQRGIVLLAGLSLLNAAWGFFGERSTRAGWRWASLAAGTLVCLPLLAVWQPRPLPSLFEQPGDETLYYREGVVATVKVVHPKGAANRLRMAVDGITIGQSLVGVDAKQQALAHLPFLLRPKSPPRRVLSIGLGTGILAGEVSRYPSVESMDVLEISPAVIEAAAVFASFNHDVLDDPKVRVIADDGVNFLRRTDVRYDAIMSDAKSRNKHAANATFFSTDYYRLCREHLDPAGLMIQWVPLDIPGSELETILRSFAAVFPQVHLLVGAPRSGFLVGSTEPLVFDMEHMRRLIDDPRTGGLRRHGIRDPYRLLALLVADGESLQPWLSANTTLNTLEHPVLEFYSPRDHAAPSEERNDDNLIRLLGARVGEASTGHRIVGADPAILGRWKEAAVQLVGALEHVEEGSPPEAILAVCERAVRFAPDHALLGFTTAAILKRAIEVHPADAALKLALAAQSDRLGNPRLALEVYRQASERHPADVAVRLALGLRLMSENRPDESLGHLDEVLSIEPDNIRALTAAAEMLATHPRLDRRDSATAIRRAEHAARLTRRRDALVLSTLATAYASAEDFARAIPIAEEALDLAGDSGLAGEVQGRLALFRQGKAVVRD